ncbi:GNAT family N-acetyltransferase [Hwanghaeella sp.]|uniref:GNAT family N-acetyltransferase n=1 Tax=Hwanghaeella sp. TaxID=2605943 RepID=UPI003CCC1154
MATEILTDRLRLRDWREDPSDVDALLAVLSDPETMKMWPKPFDREGCAGWIDNVLDSYRTHGFGRFAVELRDTGQLIGDCGLFPSAIGDWSFTDLGWILHADHHGKGYATEAARAIVDHAFSTLGLPELIAHMAEDHHASRRVAERLGMVFTHSQPYEPNRGKPHLFHRLTPAEWEQSPKASLFR